MVNSLVETNEFWVLLKSLVFAAETLAKIPAIMKAIPFLQWIWSFIIYFVFSLSYLIILITVPVRLHIYTLFISI